MSAIIYYFRTNKPEPPRVCRVVAIYKHIGDVLIEFEDGKQKQTSVKNLHVLVQATEDDVMADMTRENAVGPDIIK